MSGGGGNSYIKRGPGRPKMPVPSREAIEGATCEQHLDRLVEAVGGNVEAFRLLSKEGLLTDKQLQSVQRLARTVEIIANAKRALQETAIKGEGDLSSIPTEQLARVVVRTMRGDPALREAIAKEMERKAS